MGLYEFTGGCNEFMGVEYRQTTGHLPYDGLCRSDAWFYIHQPSVSGIVCRAGAPSPADGFGRRNGLSRYPMHGLHQPTVDATAPELNIDGFESIHGV